MDSEKSTKLLIEDILVNISKGIDDAIKQAANAMSSMHTYPERYKPLYKHAGSIDNFKGAELFMDEAELSLKYSKNHMRKVIAILRKLKSELK